MTTISTNYLLQHLNQKNLLLLKDDVGIPKPSTYNLPNSKEFTYGKAFSKDQENAKDVSMSWQYHKNSRNQRTGKDIIALNKQSISQRAQSTFRKENDIRQKLQQGKAHIDLNLPELEFSYGKKNRPSTPVHFVLGNLYGLESEIQLSDVYQQRENQRKANIRPQNEMKSNKSNNLLFQSNQQKITEMHQTKQPLFKLSKFNLVRPKTNTFRETASKLVK